MSKDFGVICLCLDDGKVQPLAWSRRKLSIKRLRKAVKQFSHDPDVVKAACMHWSRLYSSIRDMHNELPEF